MTQYADAATNMGSANRRARTLRNAASLPSTHATSTGVINNTPRTIPTRGGLRNAYPINGAVAAMSTAAHRDEMRPVLAAIRTAGIAASRKRATMYVS